MLLKEVYNQQFLENLATTIVKFDQSFDIKIFLNTLKKQHWSDLSLKQRMRAITKALDQNLSAKNYFDKVEVLKKAVVEISKDKNSGLALIIFPDFIEVFGCQDYLNTSKLSSFHFSMNSLEFFTQFGTSEFAVRQFIKLDQKAALEFFEKWTKSSNHHVRRLASEGLRPRLPWGESLIAFKKNPNSIFPILEKLKNDESEYVRKSVSNNLNDISKDHPQLVLELLNNWKNSVSSRIIKHSLRTLLKSGNKEALEIVGIKTDLGTTKNFLIKNFYLKKTKTKIGEVFEFDFALQNQSSAQNIRLEYVIYFLRKNGGQSKKIFQITSKSFSKGVFQFKKKHSFKNMTTRVHYCGEHFISLVVNGLEVEKRSFELI
jgi:3-methyladenine DNA glycosylase AlkC